MRPLAVAGLMGFALGGCSSRGGGSPVAIAVVGPMTGSAAARGKDEAQAVRMAVDEANAAGGANGRRVRMDVYDDGDQPARARELALKIASTTPALAVLGQVASSAAVAAGEVYKAQGIPAVTGAASESRVTKNNPWFYRLLPDAAGQGRFLADYARFHFGSTRIAVIREKGTAGEEFASALRDRAASLGVKIVADLEFRPAEAGDPGVMGAIAQKLSELRKEDIIVLGSQYAETPALLRVLRDRLGPFTSLGYSSLASDGVAAQFSRLNLPPAYYTEDFNVAAPQLGDVAEYAQTLFAYRYKRRYGAEPSPEAVRWYEAARLIFQAITAKGVTGRDSQGDRRRIRDWLASLNSPDSAAEGTAGPIYFDRDRNVQRGISIGVFHDGHLASAPVQFTLVSSPEQIPGWDRLSAAGMIVDSGGTRIVKTPVVYAGIDINSVDNIDLRAGTFGADFFLWYRRPDDVALEGSDIEFPTAVSGAALGKEFWHGSRGGSTTVSYHVKGVFRADYELTHFPFDRQNLRIPVQVRNSTSYTLILAYDNAGAREVGASEDSPVASSLWRMTDQIYYRDVVAYRSSFRGRKAGPARAFVEIDRINAAVTIERDAFGYVVKNFLPLVCILVAVLVGYAIAPDVVNPRVSIGVTALLTTSVLYQKLAGDLPAVTYLIAMDYVFFAFFAACVAFLALTVVTYETNREKRVGLTRFLNWAGAVITVGGILATLAFAWERYWGRV